MHREGMVEVEVLLSRRDLVPPDMRDRHARRESGRLPFEDAEARLRALLARLEENLHAEADPEEGPLVRRPGTDETVDARGRQSRRASPEDALAGDAQGVAPRYLRLVGGHCDVGTGRLEGLGHAAQVAHPVVEDGDLHRVPLVDGTCPAPRGSISTARPRA